MSLSNRTSSTEVWTAPPASFRDVCERWARGSATAFDNAVLASLTTDTPLPPPYDPTLVGFDPHTRLPPVQATHLFHAVKNDVRSNFHSTTSLSAAAVVRAALTAPQTISSPSSPTAKQFAFPSTLSAAPALAGLRNAALSALGAQRIVEWEVPLPAIENAGVPFVTAARDAGWIPDIDQECEELDVASNGSKTHPALRMSSSPDATDWNHACLINQIGRILPLANSDVIPAGHVSFLGLRSPSTRAPLPVRLLLRLFVAAGTHFSRRRLFPTIYKRSNRYRSHSLT